MRYLADTNVVLRFVHENDLQHGAVEKAVHALVTQGVDVVVVPQVLYELWVVATRPAEVNGLGWSPAVTRSVINGLLEQWLYLEDTSDLFHVWLDLVTRHGVSSRQVHDAWLIATMEAYGLEHLLTLNVEDFKRFSAITPIHRNKAAT